MIGATTSKTLDLTLLNKGDIVYGTSTIKVEIGLKTGSTIEYIPLGIFNIDDIEKTDYTIKITAFDNMIKFEKNFTTTLGDYLTLQQVVSELTRITGVEFTGTLPAYTVKKLEGFSCREVLGYVASLCGGNAVITREGKFTIVTPKDANYSIGTSNYFDYKREETKYKIGKISCQAGEEVLTKGSLGADSMELEFENPWITTAILNDIYTKLNGFEYLGYSLKWQGDLSLDVGDIVTITDKKGVVRKHPILSQKFTYTGGLTSEIGAKGETKNKNSFSSSGSTAKKIERAVMELAIINKALIDVAYIGDLTAGNIKFDTASGTIMDLQTLLSKFVTGENGQFLNLTTDNVTISNALIKDVIAKSISVEDLKAGNIDSNRFNIVGSNGNLLIKDNTIQIKDSTRVRVQIGKDASNDYNMYVWDSSGKLMFDATGLKADGIKSPIIRDDMVAGNANINGSKLNISSLISEFNKDTNTSLIQASKIAIDLTGQRLDVAFNSLETSVKGVDDRVKTNTTSISVAQGQISGLIKESTITKGDITTLKDNYTSIKATVDGINSTVVSHTSSIGSLNSNVSTIQSSITQLNNQITQKVEATEVNNIVNSAVGAIEIGGRNLLPETDGIFSSSNYHGACTITRNQTDPFGGTKAILLIGNSTSDSYFRYIYNKLLFKHTGSYVLTIWLKANKNCNFYIALNNKSDFKVCNLTTAWQKFELVADIKNIATSNHFVIGGYSTWTDTSLQIYLAFPMLEKGTKATDWTPDPEDFESSISNTNTKVSTIETNLSSITQRVSSTESNITTINGNVSSLQSRMSTAESKITPSAIISTVQTTINNAKTDAINSANSSTDTKLQSYATKSSMELTATQLKLDFSSSGGYNLTKNGNFENGTYGWIKEVFGGDNSELSVTTDSNIWTISNKKALWCFTTTQGVKERTIRQEVQTVPGKTYTLSYYIAGHRSTKIVRVRDTPNWKDIASKAYGHIEGGNNPNKWTYDSITFTATSTTTLIFFDLRDIGTNKDGHMWLHDVTVVEGNLANPWIPNKEELVNGSTVINGSGVTIYNGAITIKNNSGTDVIKGDSSGNLIMRGIFEQYGSNGVKSVDIKDNRVNLYDWSRDGDLVGGIISVVGSVDNRGKVMVYGDKGNPLSFGYCDLNRENFYSVIVIDDVKVANNGQSIIGIYEKTSFFDYSSATYYGNDHNVPLGRVGLASDNSMFILSRDTINSTYIGQMSASNTSSYTNNARINGGGLHVWGNITCSGTKTRLVPTKNFDGVKLNAYETGDCYFGDIGEGRIAEDGLCYIYLDPIFLETINTNCNYQVFLTNYGIEKVDWCRCIIREKNYFVVKGTPGIKFGWELKAKQKGYEADRLEREAMELPEGFLPIEEEEDFIEDLSIKYLSDYEKELMGNG